MPPVEEAIGPTSKLPSKLNTVKECLRKPNVYALEFENNVPGANFLAGYY